MLLCCVGGQCERERDQNGILCNSHTHVYHILHNGIDLLHIYHVMCVCIHIYCMYFCPSLNAVCRGDSVVRGHTWCYTHPALLHRDSVTDPNLETAIDACATALVHCVCACVLFSDTSIWHTYNNSFHTSTIGIRYSEHITVCPFCLANLMCYMRLCCGW